MPKTPPNHGIAVFIDFENLVTRTGVTDETFDLQPALDKLTEKGRVVLPARLLRLGALSCRQEVAA